MITKILTTILALTLISLISGSAFSQENRNKNLDRMMYTINPEVAILGPVYSDVSDSATKSKYASDLVRLILQAAHNKAFKYLEAGDFQAYHAFLTLGLTVPLHEGLYIQFRRAEALDLCRTEVNSGELLKKSSETAYNFFVQYLQTADKPFIPNCENLALGSQTQIIRGGDGSDLSIMQVSIRWHFDDFLANKKYESVAQTLDYGMEHLMNGFNPVYRNIDDYKCIVEGGSFFKKKKKKINYESLIKGIWAGKYNSGNIAKTCRFADASSPYAKHDAGFAKNLDKIMNSNGSISVDLVGDFKLEPTVAAAVKEVTDNMKNGTNNRTNLDRVVK